LRVDSPAAIPVARDSRPIERRQLTVLFCDPVGSTALSASLDPDDFSAIIAGYRRCITETVARIDGFVARHHGDGAIDSTLYPVIGEMLRAARFAHDVNMDRLDALLAQSATPPEDAAHERYPPVEIEPQLRRQRTLKALGSQLEALARINPVLVIFEDAQWACAGAPTPVVAVPPSLQASLMSRLDRFGPAKNVAQVGAAIGRAFPHMLLAALMRKPKEELDSDLDRLIAAGLVVSTRHPTACELPVQACAGAGRSLRKALTPATFEGPRRCSASFIDGTIRRRVFHSRHKRR
jgi:hypothetical protein